MDHAPGGGPQGRRVFTYGRNSDLDRMRQDAGGWLAFAPAWLEGWAHTFTGRHVVFEGGTSTLVPDPGGRVPGVAYVLAADQADRFLAVNPGYQWVPATATAVDTGERVDVAFLARTAPAPANPPAPEYLAGIRAALVQHFPPDVVDAHLASAADRAGADRAAASLVGEA